MDHAAAYVREAVAPCVIDLSAALGKLAQRERTLSSWPSAAELEKATQDIGVAAMALGPQLAKQIDAGGVEAVNYNQLELPRALHGVSALLDRYRVGRYDPSYRVPEAKEAVEALNVLGAVTMTGPIIARVIGPAVKEIGQ